MTQRLPEANFHFTAGLCLLSLFSPWVVFVFVRYRAQGSVQARWGCFGPCEKLSTVPRADWALFVRCFFASIRFASLRWSFAVAFLAWPRLSFVPASSPPSLPPSLSLPLFFLPLSFPFLPFPLSVDHRPSSARCALMFSIFGSERWREREGSTQPTTAPHLFRGLFITCVPCPFVCVRVCVWLFP